MKPRNGSINQIIDQNIQSLIDMRNKARESRSLQDKFIEAIAQFTGSVWFVYIHVILLGIWIFCNSWLVTETPFDPFPYRIFSAGASIEAIFLSTLLMINQNRMRHLESRREDLDLQMSLLIEHELTRLVRVCDLMAKKVGIAAPVINEAVAQVKEDIHPSEVLERIADAEKKNSEQ